MSKQKHYSLRSFVSYIARFKLRFSVVLFSFIIANLCLTIIPLFIGKLVGVLAESPVDKHQAYVYVVVLVACSSGHDVMWRISEILFTKLLKPIGFWYENIVFRQVINKPYPYFIDKFTGKISAYIDTLGLELRNFIDDICWNYTNEVVRLITVTIVLTSVNLYTGAIFISALLMMVVVGRYTIRNSVKYEKMFVDTQSTKTGKIVDAIANFVNVKSFQKENDETKSLEIEQSKTITASMQASFWNIIFWASMSFFVRHLIWPITILLNVYLFLEGKLSLAELTTFLSSILLFSDFIWEIVWYVSRFNIKLARSEEAYAHLFGDVNIVHEHYKDSPKSRSIQPLNNNLELRDLSFAYPDNKEYDVLGSINIVIKKGEKLGIVGKSGSGKTTLTKLLIGYYPAEKGQFLIDGQPITTKELSRIIAYVPQDTSLFHRSIADNIAYATDKEVSRQDVILAAKQAHVEEFVSQLNEGYEAVVGERGVKLSAGQRQRIAIARAFLDDKPVLILDEATSALDSESEVLVQNALEALWQDKTVIAIAHRLSTLRHMDRIIVIDQGKIIEEGTHNELLKRGGKYAELWTHQSGGFLEE